TTATSRSVVQASRRGIWATRYRGPTAITPQWSALVLEITVGFPITLRTQAEKETSTRIRACTQKPAEQEPKKVTTASDAPTPPDPWSPSRLRRAPNGLGRVQRTSNFGRA